LPGFGIELKSHFRNDLLQSRYEDTSPITTLVLQSLEVGNSTVFPFQGSGFRPFSCSGPFWNPI